MSQQDSNKSVFTTAAEDRELAKTHQSEHPSYKLAYGDEDFLARDDLRAARLQLEWLKADLILAEHDIESTVGIFGGARFQAPKSTGAEGSPEPGQAKAKTSHSYYAQARQLSSKITALSLTTGQREWVIVTGGGPGIMEAANLGALEAGGKSIGLNIVLPQEQQPNPFITPELCFQFHYFAIRKMHFLKRAKGIVVFPGGFGTLDELFDALTLMQTKKISRVPVILIGSEYWQELINFEFLVQQGAIAAEDLSLFKILDTAEQAYDYLINEWQSMNLMPDTNNP